MPLFTSATVLGAVEPPPEKVAMAVRARFWVQVQSLSTGRVQPAGQQPSPLTHAVMAVPVQLPLLQVAPATQATGGVQAIPWLAGVPPVHAPAVQVSPVRHTPMLWQLVPSGAAAGWQLCVTSEQALTMHGVVIGGQAMGVPAQNPAVQTSLLVQKKPSSQVVPSGLGVLVQERALSSQVPTLHWSPSQAQSRGTMPMQVPLWQIPEVKQKLLSGVQVAPSLPGVTMHILVGSSHTPVLHGSLGCVHCLGVPEQTPMVQVSFSVQKSPSSQGLPSFAGMWTHTLSTHDPTPQASLRALHSV
jgi:hypothetical protein